jgi:hypothetical protein
MQADQQLAALLHQLAIDAKYLANSQSLHCIRCKILGRDTLHEWRKCPMVGSKEAQLISQRSNIWVKNILSLKDDPLGNSCCPTCLFAQQDTRFHNNSECLFPTVAPEIIWTVLNN